MDELNKKVVRCIWEARQEKLTDPELLEQLTNLGLSESQSHHALDMVEQSLQHAFTEASCQRHHCASVTDSPFAGDPYFKLSLAWARRRFPADAQTTSPVTYRRYFLGTLILVGIGAVFAIVLFVIAIIRSN